jgi:hypothetical protein
VSTHSDKHTAATTLAKNELPQEVRQAMGGRHISESMGNYFEAASRYLPKVSGVTIPTCLLADKKKRLGGSPTKFVAPHWQGTNGNASFGIFSKDVRLLLQKIRTLPTLLKVAIHWVQALMLTPWYLQMVTLLLCFLLGLRLVF